MKLLAALIILAPLHSFAANAVLTINDFNSFFSAFNGRFIQDGKVVNFRNLDSSKASCSTAGHSVPSGALRGQLSFSKKNTGGDALYRAPFEFQDRKSVV